jgi:FixJ family two-component response regulator
MRDANPSVLIIDDDPEFRDSVGRLLRTVGLAVGNFHQSLNFSAPLLLRMAQPVWWST